jgi:hypothetical protein
LTYPITDQFQDPRGRWNGYVPYSATEQYDDEAHYLITQEHIDVRSMQAGEAWVQTIFSGAHGDMIVAKLGERSGWSGLQFTTDGNPLDVQLTSSLPGDNLDLSTQHTLSLVLPDYNTFDLDRSYVQLTSHPDGTFGTSGDSDQVSFAAADIALGAHRYSQIAIALDTHFQNVGQFDISQVNGIKIRLYTGSPPPPTTVITVMAIRAVRDDWVESNLDFDTRRQILCKPVTLDGLTSFGTVLRGIELIRGDGSKNDPIPINGTYTLVFSPGGELTSDLLQTLTGILGRDELARLILAGVDLNNLVVLTTHYNQISLIARKTDWEPEDEDDSIEDTGSGSYIKFNFFWNNQKTFYYAERINDSEESATSTTLDFQFLDFVLNPERLYAFSAKLVNETAELRLTHVDTFNKEVATVWNYTLTSDNLNPVNGRVGFAANFLFNDAYIKDYIGAPSTFSRLRSEVLRQRTPVDGAQLTASFSDDINLYTSVTGTDLFQDATKTVSGLGSWRTAVGVTTNDFIADDWEQMYLRMALWIGNVTADTQPDIVLNTPGGPEHLPVPLLQSNQWNYLLFDLNLFKRHLEGLPYSFSALPQDNDLIWVDNIIIGRRRVAWSMRATQNGIFRYFWDTVNDPFGALHLPGPERGVYLQFQAEALTDDAWAAQPSFLIRHAQLGLPLYDVNYEKR